MSHFLPVKNRCVQVLRTGFITLQSPKGLIISKQTKVYELKLSPVLPKGQAGDSIFSLVKWFVEI